jgi:hypothetical protein
MVLIKFTLLILYHGIDNLKITFRTLSNLLAETLGFILLIVVAVYFINRNKIKKKN